MPRAMQQTKSSSAEIQANQITEREEEDIVANRGKRLRLARTLAALYGIQPKALEVGATLCTKHGFKTHCVQFVDETDLQRMRQKLADANHGVIDVSPELYVGRVYEAVQEQIAEALRAHFNLSSDFEVELVHNRDDKGRNAGGTQARLMFAIRNYIADDNAQKVHNLVDMLKSNPVANAPDEGEAGAAEQGATELQMVATMSTRPEDLEDAIHEDLEDGPESPSQGEEEAAEQKPDTSKVDEMHHRAVCTKKDCDTPRTPLL